MPIPSRSVPPRLSARPSLSIFAVTAIGFAGIAGAAILYFFNPTSHNFYPECQFHQITGLYCPGCGATRASYQLLHGNLLKALHENALYVFSLGALAIRGAWVWRRKRQGRPACYFVPPAVLWSFLVVALVFTVLRNLPAFSFLAPY